MTTLIEKDACVYVYNVFDKNGTHLPSFELIIGEDILTSDDDYTDFNNSMVVTFEDVGNAVYEYILDNRQEVEKYEFDIDE